MQGFLPALYSVKGDLGMKSELISFSFGGGYSFVYIVAYVVLSKIILSAFVSCPAPACVSNCRGLGSCSSIFSMGWTPSRSSVNSLARLLEKTVNFLLNEKVDRRGEFGGTEREQLGLIRLFKKRQLLRRDRQVFRVRSDPHHSRPGASEAINRRTLGGALLSRGNFS